MLQRVVVSVLGVLVALLWAGSAVCAQQPASDAPAVTPAATPSSPPSPSSPTSFNPKPLPGGRNVVLPPDKAEPVRLPRFEKAPVIDGNLDDAAWAAAAVLKDFYQVHPGDNIAPSKPTEML